MPIARDDLWRSIPARKAMSPLRGAVPPCFVLRYKTNQPANSRELRSFMPESTKGLNRSKRSRDCRFVAFRLSGRTGLFTPQTRRVGAGRAWFQRARGGGRSSPWSGPPSRHLVVREPPREEAGHRVPGIGARKSLVFESILPSTPSSFAASARIRQVICGRGRESGRG